HHDVQHPVQPCQHAIDTATLFHTYARILVRTYQLPGRYHVRPAEPDETVTIGMSLGHMKYLHAFAIEELADAVTVGMEHFDGKAHLRKVRLRIENPVQYVLVRHHIGGGRNIERRKRDGNDRGIRRQL